MDQTELLVAELLTSHEHARRTALQRLPTLRGDASQLVSLLVRTLSDEEQRRFALHALRQLGRRAHSAAPSVLEAIEASHEPRFIRIDEEGQASIQGPVEESFVSTAWETLLAIARSAVLADALTALSWRDDTPVIADPHQSARILDVLLKRLRRAERASAAQARKRRRDAKSMPSYLRRVLSQPNYEDLTRIVSAMGFLRGDVVNALRVLVEHPVAEIRDSAARSLSRMGQAAESCADGLIAAVSNPALARPLIAEALADVAGEQPAAVSALATYLARPDGDAPSAARALAKLGALGVAALREAMNSPNPAVRRAVLLAAEREVAIASAMIQELERGVTDTAAGAQSAAAWALRHAVSEPNQCLRIVLRQLARQEGLERHATISALELFWGASPLVNALGDEDMATADAAADVLVAHPRRHLTALVDAARGQLPSAMGDRAALVLARIWVSIGQLDLGQRRVDVPWLIENWDLASGLVRSNATEILEALEGPRFPGVMFARAPEPPSAAEVRGAVQRRAEVLEQASIAIDRQSASALASIVGAAELPRYTDLTIFAGHLYAGDTPPSARRVADDEPLRPGEYTLEVAIRAVRTGLRDDKISLRSLQPTAASTKDRSVYVYARSSMSDLAIVNNFERIDWPRDCDSDPAFIRVDTKWSPADNAEEAERFEMLGRSRKGRVEVRVFDSNLDLLDAVDWEVVIAPSGPLARKLWRGQDLSWPSLTPQAVEPSSGARSRAMSINVYTDGDGYQLNFILRDATGDHVQIASRRIAVEDLKRLNRNVQNFWTQLVISNYSEQLVVSKPTFDKSLERLRKLGVEAWDLLFGARYGSSAEPSESLGALLSREHLLNEGDMIQVALVGTLAFTFPWALLCPPSATVDAGRAFWGVRFQIEQVTKGRESDHLDQGPVQALFALDRGFGNAANQEALFASYKTRARERLEVTGPISDQTALLAALCRDPAVHLVYCYCHSYTASGHSGPMVSADGVHRLRKAIKKVADESHRQALETLFNLIQHMDDTSWMFIGNSEISEWDLRHQYFFRRRKPIVFMNSCQSAALEPSVTAGLARVFWDHDASVVIGTESVMTPTFAHEFGRRILDALLSGTDVATAMQEARRHFLHECRNPLALAYTLYGRGSTRLTTRNLLENQDEHECQ